jgi:septal ring factor EnvC (AmiA/AmiB activator)
LIANHEDERDALVCLPTAAIVPAETLRSTAGFVPSIAQPQRPEEKLPLFWRVFGGTMLSIAALVCITVYQQFNTGLYDLRKEINAQHEARADLIKKDELNNRLTPMWAGIKDAQAANSEVAALKERCTQLQDQLKAVDIDRKQLTAEVQQLRDRLVLLEGRLDPRPQIKNP